MFCSFSNDTQSPCTIVICSETVNQRTSNLTPNLYAHIYISPKFIFKIPEQTPSIFFDPERDYTIKCSMMQRLPGYNFQNM